MADRELIDKLATNLSKELRDDRPEVFETHISWVLLAGPYAYKIKKPVDYGFVDFSSLEKRQYYCQRELELNQRLAPDLYLEVIPVCSSGNTLHLDGSGEIVDWALKLKRFDSEQQLDRLAGQHRLSAEMIDDLTRQVLAFHQSTEIIGPQQRHGYPQQVQDSVLENCSQIHEALSHKFARLESKAEQALLNSIQPWLQQQFLEHSSLMAQRKQEGCIRDCHGDLHLANIAWHNNHAIIFDCIEFNDSFRYIDVISDLAFLVMDLMHRGYYGLACRCINEYFQKGGDYQSLGLLRYYMVYRALVRAKVSLLSSSPSQIPQACRQYLELASAISNLKKPPLLITHGVSGTGKSQTVRSFYNNCFFLHLSSDIERKRLQPKLDPDLYSEQARQRIYEHLQDLAIFILQAGWPCIVDATFLERKNRSAMQKIAHDLGLELGILHFESAPDILKLRLQLRSREKADSQNPQPWHRQASDADVSVLQNQLQNYTPLSKEELKYCLAPDQARKILITFLSNFP